MWPRWVLTVGRLMRSWSAIWGLVRLEVAPVKAATTVALAPIGAVEDTADLAAHSYEFVSPEHRVQRKWRSINFVLDLKGQTWPRFSQRVLRSRAIS